MAVAKGNELATTSDDGANVSNYLALSMPTSEIREIITGALGDEGLTPRDLQRVKLPAGGGVIWTLDTPDGEDSAKHIDCVIIAQRQVRTYWAKSLEESGGRTPPDCYSEDAIHGIGNPGIECATCPNAEFGTGKGKSQACQLKRLIFFLTEGSLLPSYVALPPTSQAEGKSYITKLAANGKMPWDVLTRLTLEKVRNDQNIEYSRVKMVRVGNLSNEDKARMRAVVQELRPALQTARLAVATDIDGEYDHDDSTGRGVPTGAYVDDGEAVEEI